MLRAHGSAPASALEPVPAGGAGVACATKEGDEIAIEALKVTLVSTHGAGDEFTGVLAAEIARGTGMHDALNRAHGRVADRINHVLGPRDELSRIGNELPRDRIVRIMAIDQRGQ